MSGGVARARPAVPLAARSRGLLVGVVLMGLAAFAWPLVLPPVGTTAAGIAPVVFAATLALALLVVLVDLSAGGLDAKALALLGVLAAVGAILRPLGAGVGGIEPIFFLLVLGGRVFGPGFGFTQGAVTLFASALLTAGVGPWLPYQMLAAAFVGLGAGMLPRATGRAEIVLLAAWGCVASFGFGWLVDLAFWPLTVGPATELSYVPGAPPGENLHRFVVFNAATSMGWNVGRAATTVVLLVLTGPGLLRVLRRTARRASFDVG